MLQVGNRVRVKARTDGPNISSHLAHLRLRLCGETGIVEDVVPQLDRPIVVGFSDPDLPHRVRFWGYDLLEVGQ